SEKAIWKVVVGGDAIELRGGLVLERGPALAAVHGDRRATVVRLGHPQRIVRVDPEVVVVAVRRRDGRPRLPAVFRLVESDVDDVDAVGIFGISIDARVVPGALAEVAAVAGLGPRLAAAARAEHAAFVRLDDGVDVLRSRGGNAHADAAE